MYCHINWHKGLTWKLVDKCSVLTEVTVYETGTQCWNVVVSWNWYAVLECGCLMKLVLSVGMWLSHETGMQCWNVVVSWNWYAVLECGCLMKLVHSVGMWLSHETGMQCWNVVVSWNWYAVLECGCLMKLVCCLYIKLNFTIHKFS